MLIIRKQEPSIFSFYQIIQFIKTVDVYNVKIVYAKPWLALYVVGGDGMGENQGHRDVLDV